MTAFLAFIAGGLAMAAVHWFLQEDPPERDPYDDLY